MKGYRIRVPSIDEVRSSVPPQHSFPYVWPFLAIGTTEERFGKKSLPLYLTADSIDPDTIIPLKSVESIRIRLTTQVTSSGTCSIVAHNHWVARRDSKGRLLFERLFEEQLPFEVGSEVWYLSPDKFDGETLEIQSGGWVRGHLVSFDGQRWTVELEDGRRIKTTEERLFTPKQSRILPMHKIMVFGLNRFYVQALQRMPFEEVGRFTLEELLSQSPSAVSNWTTTPIFTGYVTSVTHKRAGASHLVTLNASDVLIWTDLSLMNRNPALVPDYLGIFGREPYYDFGQTVYQVFTTRFAGVPAQDIVRALFFGASLVEVKSQTNVYSKPDTNSRVVGEVSAGTPGLLVETFPALDLDLAENVDEVLSRGRWARVTFKVRPDPGAYGFLSGWVPLSQIVYEKRLISGIGSFQPYTGTDQNRIELQKLQHSEEVARLFTPDKLKILDLESFDTPEDADVIVAYNEFFRSNPPEFVSQYATRRSLLAEVCRTTNTELWADGAGIVHFHPIRAYLPADEPELVIHPEECISWAATEDSSEVKTWVFVTGQVSYDYVPPVMIQNHMMADPEIIRRFGMRAIQVSNPNIRSPEAARAYAFTVLQRLLANRLQAQVTIVFRPEILPGRNVYIPWLNRVYYVHAVTHEISWGRSATTTLDLKYGRFPWEVWYPLVYKAEAASEATTPSVKVSRVDKELDSSFEKVLNDLQKLLQSKGLVGEISVPSPQQPPRFTVVLRITSGDRSEAVEVARTLGFVKSREIDGDLVLLWRKPTNAQS